MRYKLTCIDHNSRHVKFNMFDKSGANCGQITVLTDDVVSFLQNNWKGDMLIQSLVENVYKPMSIDRINPDFYSPWQQRVVAGYIEPIHDVPEYDDYKYIVKVRAALTYSGEEVALENKLCLSKQDCWDFIARNYPNQIFYWRV